MKHIDVLAKTVKSDRKDARISRGLTNGSPVLHVRADRQSYTLRTLGDWLACPLHPHAESVAREHELDELHEVIANRDAR